MKKFFSMMVALVALVTLASCGNETEEPVTKTALAKPVLSVQNVTENGFTVTWATVANASGYMVDLAGDVQNVTGNSVAFENLTPGEYTVRVKAVAAAGSNYTDSAWATCTQTVAGSSDWFTQSVYTKEDAENGAYTYNTIFVMWKGTGIKSIKYGLFSAAESTQVDDDTILAYLQFVEGDFVESANSADGVELYISANPSTEYEFVALATNEAGQSILARDTVTTTAAPANPLRDAWVGTWRADFTSVLRWDVQGEYVAPTVVEGVNSSYDLTITAHETQPDYLVITGFSALDPTLPALAFVDDEGWLGIINQVRVGEADADGYAPIWLCYTNAGPVTGEFAAYYAAPAEDGVTNGLGGEGTLNDGTEFKVVSLEVYAINFEEGDLSLYEESFPVDYKAGDFTLTKVDAAAQVASYEAFTFPQRSSYVVNIR